MAVRTEHPLRKALVIGLPTLLTLIIISWIGLRAMAADNHDQYATETVGRGDVDQNLAVGGTLSAANQTSVGFPSAGTVATVNVGVGDHVTAGQTLATMNTDDLELAVTQAKANLASAKADLERAQESSTSASSSSNSSSGSDPASSPPNSTGTAPASGQLTKLQQQVARDTRSLEQATANASAAFQRQQQACAFLGVQPPSAAPSAGPSQPSGVRPPSGRQRPADFPITPTPTPKPSPTPTPSPTPSTSASPSGIPTTSAPRSSAPPTAPVTNPPSAPSSSGAQQQELTTCVQAVQQTVAAQQQLSAQQAALSSSLSALGQAIGGTSRQGTAPRTSSGTNQTSGSTSTPRSGAQSAGPQGMTVAEAGAEVESARTQLDLARKALEQATITSPIDGVVATNDFTAGATMSTSDKIVITGHGAMEATVDVSQKDLPAVRLGEHTTVGGGGSTGTVTAIGLLPSGSADSGATYPVTITINHPAADLTDGSTASGTISIKSAQNVIRVPISAVTRHGKTGTVTVLEAGRPVQKTVQLGAVGSTMIEITSGLSAGQTVVLADRSRALPNSNLTGPIGVGRRAVVVGAPR